MDIYNDINMLCMHESGISPELANQLINDKRELDKAMAYPYHGDVKLKQIEKLIEEFGSSLTLGEVLQRVKGKDVYKCPKCNGNGYIEEEYNGYPSGLPDSGFVYEPKYKKVTCTLCKGKGYTSIKYKPHYVQDGWEEENTEK